jgi:hypothetical protein
MIKNKKLLIIGDSYGLPRIHKDDNAVCIDECWPNIIEKHFTKKGVDVTTYFKYGLTVNEAQSFITENDFKGCYVVYAGGLVDFFPRTIPKLVAYSTMLSMFRRITFKGRQKLHKYGLVYSWTNMREYSRFLNEVAVDNYGTILSIPPLVSHQIKNNPNSNTWLASKNIWIKKITLELGWTFLDLDEFLSNDSYFHPYDGHYNIKGNAVLASEIEAHLTRKLNSY